MSLDFGEIEMTTHPLEDSESKTFIRLFITTPEDGVVGYYGAFADDYHPDVLEAEALVVQPAFRGRGLGERLVRKMVEVAKGRGVRKIRSHIESQYSLDIRARIFGKGSMKFFLDSPTHSKEAAPEQYEELPITFEQARASLVHAGRLEDPESRTIGFTVEQDIDTLPDHQR